jgi:arylsulfatase A-like enzyme
MDHEIGRLLQQLREMHAFEDTLVLFLSDNGADATVLVRGDRHDPTAAPGSAGSYLCLGPGWASASNAPFRRYKVWVHEAGISTPLIAHWPNGIAARGELRRDVGHVIDLLPTILELAGGSTGGAWNGEVPPPLPGKSLVPALRGEGRVVRDWLYFHHEGNRALRQGDWKIVSAREDHDAWELYDLASDRAESNDLAARDPERVRAMAACWQRCEDGFRHQAGEPPPVAPPAR